MRARQEGTNADGRPMPGLADDEEAASKDRKSSLACNGPVMLCLVFTLVLCVGSVLGRLGSEWRWSGPAERTRGAKAAEHTRSNESNTAHTSDAGTAAVPNNAAGIAGHEMHAANRMAELEMEAVDGSVATDDRPYDYDFLIVVPAGAHELERREAVRGSWAKYIAAPHCEVCRRYKVRMVFVVGNEGNATESRLEAVEKGDMGVLEDFGQEQSYTKRSRKTLLSIRYAVQHFTFRFLLKCDMDSWVYVDRLLEFFESKQLWTKPKLYAGDFQAGAGAYAIQQQDSKWYDPVFPSITGFLPYPKHAKGAGYILSRLLAEALADEPEDYWAEVPCEDVAVGFWLAAVRNEKMEIPVSLDPACGSAVLVDHYVTPEIMAERWQTYEKSGSPCNAVTAALRGSRGGGGGGLEPARIDRDGFLF